MKHAHFAATLLSFVLAAQAANLTLVAEYSGANFFDKWDFYGDSTAGQKGPWNGVRPYDDTTNGVFGGSMHTWQTLMATYRRRFLYGQGQWV